MLEIVIGTKSDKSELVRMYFWELKVVTEFPDEKDICPTEVTFIDEEEFKDRFWFEDNVNEEAVL